ncbi:MAG: hypothetical protein KA954_12900 [Chitinophagales bacterium]|nr:hypothetical protein [Chitinophagales bacterium]
MSDKLKVSIELTPYNALSILAFCREWINEDTKGWEKFKAINEAVDAYESEIYLKVNNDHLDDAEAENLLNELFGRCP